MQIYFRISVLSFLFFSLFQSSTWSATSEFKQGLRQALDLLDAHQESLALALLDRLEDPLMDEELDLFRLRALMALGGEPRALEIVKGLLTRNSHLKKEALEDFLSAENPAFVVLENGHLALLDLLDEADRPPFYQRIAETYLRAGRIADAFEWNQKIFSDLRYEQTPARTDFLAGALKQGFRILHEGAFYKEVPAATLVRRLVFSTLDPLFPRDDLLTLHIGSRLPLESRFAHSYLVMESLFRKKAYTEALRRKELLEKLSPVDSFLVGRARMLACEMAIRTRKAGEARRILTLLRKAGEVGEADRLEMNLYRMGGNIAGMLEIFPRIILAENNHVARQALAREYFSLAEQAKIPVDGRPVLNHLVARYPTGNYMEEILYLAYLNPNRQNRVAALDRLKKFHPYSFFLRELESEFRVTPSRDERALRKAHPDPVSAAYRRGRVFEEIGRYDLAYLEYDFARRVHPDEWIRITEAMADLQAKAGRLREAVVLNEDLFDRLARQAGSVDRVPLSAWLRRYPTHFTDEVHFFSQRAGVSPALVFAVMREESRFDANAISRSKARGLMQIMAATGRWIQQARQKPQVGTQGLFHPRNSVEMGSWYLGYLIESLGVLEHAVCAYNGGMGNVRKWLKAFPAGQDNLLIFWKHIALPETRRYLYKVMGSFHAYRVLYPGEVIPKVVFPEKQPSVISTPVAKKVTVPSPAKKKTAPKAVKGKAGPKPKAQKKIVVKPSK